MGKSWFVLAHAKDRDFHSDNQLMVRASYVLCEAQYKMKTLGLLFKVQEKKCY